MYGTVEIMIYTKKIGVPAYDLEPAYIEADFDLEVTDQEITLRVRQCPAIAHIRKVGLPLSKCFCRSTTEISSPQTMEILPSLTIMLMTWSRSRLADT